MSAIKFEWDKSKGLEPSEALFVASLNGKKIGWTLFVRGTLISIQVKEEYRKKSNLANRLLDKAIIAYLKKNPNYQNISLVAVSTEKKEKQKVLEKWYTLHGFKQVTGVGQNFRISREKAFELEKKRKAKQANAKEKHFPKPSVPKPQRKRVR